MEQQTLFKIRDRRKKGWFFMDNEYLNGYARVFGAVGTAIYVSLCRHADNETQTCFPSMDLISEELAISRPTIIKYLKMFEEYKIVAITKEKDTKGRQKNNVYLLLDKEEWIPSKDILHGKAELNGLTHPSKTDEKSRVKPVYHKETNTNYTHIKETHTAGKPAGKEVNDIISLFNEVNPSYKKWYKITTQRKAIENLLKELGREQLEKVIKFLSKTNNMQYAPTITTPLQLEDKLAQLKAFINKNMQPRITKI